ncbi:MAG: DNA-binding response regulator, partial [Pseudomonadota bacterium]
MSASGLARATGTVDEHAPHLLVVDDDDRIRDLLHRYLTDHGLRTSLAANAREARRLLGAVDFDLLVL